MGNVNYIESSTADAVRWAFVAIFTMFAILSGFLLPIYLKDLKKQELDRISKVYQSISNTKAFRQAEQSSDQFSLASYIAPVAFTSAIIFIFSVIVFFGSSYEIQPDFILGSDKLYEFFPPNVKKDHIVNYERVTMMVMSFAFLGSYVWSIQYILLRIASRDINPGQLYQIGISIIFSVILAISIRHAYNALFDLTALAPDETVLAAMAFLIGLFPNFFLEWLRSRFEGQWFGKPKRADELPLNQIEGISDFTIFRLRELDISNAQNLAHANPVTLYTRTRYGLNQCIDWVSQAQLLVLFKFENTEKLRAFGVRTITDFDRFAGAADVWRSVSLNISVTSDDNVPEQGKGYAHNLLNIPPEQLAGISRNLSREPSYVRLKELIVALSTD